MTASLSPWNRRLHRIAGGLLLLAALSTLGFAVASEFAWTAYHGGFRSTPVFSPRSRDPEIPRLAAVVGRFLRYLLFVAPAVYVGLKGWIREYGARELAGGLLVVVLADLTTQLTVPAMWYDVWGSPWRHPHVEPWGLVTTLRWAWVWLLLGTLLSILCLAAVPSKSAGRAAEARSREVAEGDRDRRGR